jgi:hypothetical protein
MMDIFLLLLLITDLYLENCFRGGNKNVSPVTLTMVT